VGLRGMPRRVYTYPAGMGWDWLNLVESVGAVVTVIGVLLFVINVLWSRRHGAIAPSNPWGASTLEWAVSSPPPEYNFAVIPTVRGRDPLWEVHDPILGPAGQEDLAAPDPARARERGGEEHAPHITSLPDWRVLDQGKEALESTLLNGDPQAVLRMPHDTLWPLVLSLALTALFAALLCKAPVWTAVAGMLSLASIAGWLWPTAATFPPARRTA
jgi:cytochrome c oxidase subunit I+III